MEILCYIDAQEGVLMVTLNNVWFALICLSRDSLGNNQFNQDWNDNFLASTSRTESLYSRLKRLLNSKTKLMVI